MFTDKVIIQVPTWWRQFTHVHMPILHAEWRAPDVPPKYKNLEFLGKHGSCIVNMRDMGEGWAGLSPCGDMLYFSYVKKTEGDLVCHI